MDIAASIQAVTEEVMIKLAKEISKSTGETNLCLAGGVALNCVANGKLLREKIFKNIWIQPAAGDAGGAVGAALSAYYLMFNKHRQSSNDLDGMKGAYLGPEFSQTQIESELTQLGAVFNTLQQEEIIYKTAQALADGKAIGWMQGRMEFGPRSLGCRSILADPRSPKTQQLLNLKIKYRESFRPFAPSILREDVLDWFDLDGDSPYMLLVANIANAKQRNMTSDEQLLFGIEKLNVLRSDIPAVTHVDYSARVQTVHEQTNPIYHKLIKEFKKITGCPVLVNTSFNVRGEPIVCSPTDAFKCFMGTELDILVVGNSFLEKTYQDKALQMDYKTKYELD
jgi:carbamoyltransferase